MEEPINLDMCQNLHSKLLTSFEKRYEEGCYEHTIDIGHHTMWKREWQGPEQYIRRYPIITVVAIDVPCG